MRKYLFLLFFVFVAFTFTSTTCNESEEVLCDAYEKDLIERAFVISAKISYADNVAYQGEVGFNIEKNYCSGEVSGEYKIMHIEADEYGNWVSGMQYKYYLGNSQDNVTIRFRITNPGGQPHYPVYTFSYADVVNESFEIKKTYNIILPWEAPYD